MLTGLILLLCAAVFGVIGLLLPRLGKSLRASLEQIPQGMRAMASSLVPGLDTGLRLLKLFPPITLAAYIAAFTFGGLGIYALFAKSVPLVLQIFAYLVGTMVVGAAIGLVFLWKKYGSHLMEMNNLRGKLRL